MERLLFDPYDLFGYLASGLLVVVGMDLVLGFPHVLGRDLKVTDMALLILAIYVAGQMVATPAKAIFEDGIVDKVLKRPNLNLFRKKKPAVLRVFFPGFYKPLPEEIRDRVVTKAMADGLNASGEALFLHVRYHPQVLGNESLMTKLAGFLNKYGFARNLAFTSFVVGAAMLLKTRVTPDPMLAHYGYTLFVAGVLLFYRYLKFLRQYSYELFNVYAGMK
jgi:hypothetical protein